MGPDTWRKLEDADLDLVVGGRYALDGVPVRRPIYRDGVGPDRGPEPVYDLICPPRA